jgi:hypothetical protein
MSRRTRDSEENMNGQFTPQGFGIVDPSGHHARAKYQYLGQLRLFVSSFH